MALLKTVAYTALNSLKRKNFGVMARKVILRFKEPVADDECQRVLEWCKDHAEPCDVFLKALDEDLWDETQQACVVIRERAEKSFRI